MPLDDQPVIIDDEPLSEGEKLEEDMKPLIVLNKIPKLDESVGGTCAVSMKQLVLRPVHNKLPTAHRGKLFKGYNAPGQKRVVRKIENNADEKNHDEQKAETDVKELEVGNELDVKDINMDKDEGSECQGDAKVQLATGMYNEWLADQGLLMLSEPEERYDLKLKVKDISDSEETVNKAEDGNKTN